MKILVQYTVQNRNRIAEGLNGIKKSISNSTKDPHPIVTVERTRDPLCSGPSNRSPSELSKNEYFDNDILTPDKGIDLKDNQDYSEDQLSRGINTAATDTKSCTNTSDRKRVGKSAVRRKRKNINIRKLNKNKIGKKKSTKSLAKNPANE